MEAILISLVCSLIHVIYVYQCITKTYYYDNFNTAALSIHANSHFSFVRIVADVIELLYSSAKSPNVEPAGNDAIAILSNCSTSS
jgi:hypothetical protein